MTDETPQPAPDETPQPAPVPAPPVPAAPVPAPLVPAPPVPAPLVPAPPVPAPPVPAPPVVMGPALQNGMGTAALVMGILQFVCLGPIASILAIVFGRIGINKAKQGLANNGGVAKAGFWLGIVGLILTVIGIIVAVVAIGFGVKVANDALDPAKNSQTGLPDGTYQLDVNTSVFLNDRCSFGGTAIDEASQEAWPARVNVVGVGSAECGPTMETPGVVTFSVTGGVAKISAVN